MKSIFLVLCIFFAASVWCTDQLDYEPCKILTEKDGLLYWERSEAYRDRHSAFGREKILDVSKIKNPQVLNAFPADLYKDDTSDASVMVLFSAPGWNFHTKTPVLLIHGAGDDPNRAWVHPYSLTTPESVPEAAQGFMQRFSNAGFPVFAVGFSHHHGCNYKQAEQIHNAIQIIKKKTRTDKVHILAHSKGNCAASIYVSGGKDVNPELFSFLSPFKKDVAQYIQIGPGNKGIDIIFRYYLGNVYSLSNKLSSPVCFYRAVYYGMWTDFYEKDIYKGNPGKEIGNYFPGQCQLVNNLVDDGLDFSSYSYTPIDFNLTMKACYYGGTTMYVQCYGIDHSMKEGGYTIKRLNEKGMDPSVSLINIYGTNPVIQEIDLGFIKIPIGVSDHPSDGLVYSHSASYIKGHLSRGAKLTAQKAFHLNHFGIAMKPEVFSWLEKLLD